MSLLLGLDGDALPRVLHWGAALGEVSETDVAALLTTDVPQRDAWTSDVFSPLTVAPQYSSGWAGTPAVTGHRDGRDFSPRFALADLRQGTGDAAEGVLRRVELSADDPDAALGLLITIELLVGGLLRSRTRLVNRADGVFTVGTVDTMFPVPPEADEILGYTGRWLRERSAQRHAFTAGTHLRENRVARGHDTTMLLAGREGFRNRAGEVWAAHVGWSGNTRLFAERVMPSGDRVIGGGELLLAGEVRLARDEAYESPWVYLSYGDGVDAASARFHDFLRARAVHPSSPRRVNLNVWEAVYMNHDLPRLIELADRAAQAGVERYVLDDGWFRGRRDDTAGLGDWYVDETVWPRGLHPLTDHVVGLGMEFGLWVEPEMVSEDSDLARAHPEWILRTPHRMPPPSRHQQVLDLAHQGAWRYVFDRIDALLTEYPVSYLKWDHNRAVIDAGHLPTGVAGVHGQTLALYRLLDAIRAAHPGVEIESCASGGGRIDLGIATRTDRVWTSDTIDALERQAIQHGTGMLLPPELIGSHIGAERAHTTGRHHDLGFRAATAFFWHLGVEWDLTRIDDADLTELGRWIAAYREHRALLHGGRSVTADAVDPALRIHGVVAPDGGEAIFAVVQLTTGVAASAGRITLPGLHPDTLYTLRPLPPGDRLEPRGALGMWWPGPLEATGRVLGTVGIRFPAQDPEHSVLLHLTASRP